MQIDPRSPIMQKAQRNHIAAARRSYDDAKTRRERALDRDDWTDADRWADRMDRAAALIVARTARLNAGQS